jgi:RNA polymerase sigma factor for flagellar operon FliA
MKRAVSERTDESPRPSEAHVLEHLPFVKWIAYRLAVRLPETLDIQDLISAGTVGLLQALRDFDPSRKNQFKTYASIRIRGAMLDAIREQDWVPRSFRDRYKRYVQRMNDLANRLGREPNEEEIRNDLGLSQAQYEVFLRRARSLSFLSLEDLHVSNEMAAEVAGKENESARRNPALSAERSEVRSLLERAIDSLPERERLIIQLYYYEELNLKEIGKVLGVGESRVCQLQTQALMRLKGKLRKEALDG